MSFAGIKYAAPFFMLARGLQGLVGPYNIVRSCLYGTQAEHDSVNYPFEVCSDSSQACDSSMTKPFLFTTPAVP